MKPLHFFFVVFLLFNSSLVKSQNYSWANNTVTASSASAARVATDAAGFVYVVGFYGDYMNNVPFDQVVGGGYLAKYSPAGNLLWAKPMGTEAFDVDIDASGKVYVVGRFNGISPVADTVLPQITLNDHDAYLGCFDSSGTRIWVQTVSDHGHEYIYGICADANKNVSVCGNFVDTLVIGDTSLIAVGPSGKKDVFIAQYDSNGVFKWTRRAGGTVNDECYAIDNDPAGNLYITGYYQGPATFGTTTLTSYLGIPDIFVARYNANGTFAWADNYGTNFDEAGRGIYVDNSSNVYVAARYSGNNIWIGRYSSTGSLNFSYSPTGGIFMSGTDVVADIFGNMYLTGYFQQNTTFNSTTLYSAGATDIFVAKFDAIGNFQWALNSGGTSDDFSYGICTDQSNNLFIAGYFNGVAIFGPDTLYGLDSLYSDMFVAKIDQNLPTSFSAQNNSGLNSISLFPNPSSENQIYLAGNFKTGAIQISIFDLTGKLLSENEMMIEGDKKEIAVPVNALSSGMYILQVSSKEKTEILKFIRE